MGENKFLLPLNLQTFADNKGPEMTLKSLSTEFKEAWGELKDLLDKQDQEIKSFGTTREDTVNQIKSVEGKLQGFGEELKDIQAKYDDIQKKLGRPGLDDPTNQAIKKTLGTMFIESDSFKNMKANNSYNSSPFKLKSLYPGKKQLTTAPGSAGVLTGTERADFPIFAPQRAFRLRDLIPVEQTDSNAIEYVQESGFVNSAAPVPETMLKPQSSLNFDLLTESVKTIAHWIPASRQVLDDANQLRAYIDNRLLYGLMLVEEAQILYGNGTSPNLQGVLTHPGIQSYTWSEGEAGDTKIDAIRRAITLARIAEYPVNTIVLHPNDWEDIQLLKADNGMYIWVNVNEGGQMRLWAVPVVETTAIAEGTALIGAFGMGAMLWDREEANIRVSESNNDDFVRNMVTILAEERIALTIFRPEAFVEVTFDSAPTAGA